VGTWVTANVARDDQTSKQQCDEVVKREKSKTHEAQTTSRVLGDTATQERGPVLGARPRMMTKTFWGHRRVERQRQRLAYARLGGCSGSRQRATSKYCYQCDHYLPICFSRTRDSRSASICDESSTLTH
jgi:hypothetical protein